MWRTRLDDDDYWDGTERPRASLRRDYLVAIWCEVSCEQTQALPAIDDSGPADTLPQR